MAYTVRERTVNTGMNIKEAAKESGVSSQNIRFYERENLLHPKRDPNNSYRIYSPEDLRTLKLIRMLRMLDMPLEEIRLVLEQKTSLSQALSEQEQRLHARENELQSAIRFCRNMRSLSLSVDKVDVDACLQRMKKEPEQTGFFADWMQDYKHVVAAQHRELFTFVPNNAVTTPREFTDALLAWADSCDKDIVIIRESMYPRFLLDGAEYEAERVYRRIGYRYCSVPQAIIRCRLRDHNSEDECVPPVRRRILRILRCAFPGTLLFVLIMVPNAGWILAGGQTWMDFMGTLVFVLGIAALCGLGAWYNYYYHFNDRTR